ncbi:MAG: class I SAM-dependent methyltransferase [Caldilineaceae bacterium]|nr:class I SAM-dependent methyltransferase [Caldilineaceae bacterium]
MPALTEKTALIIVDVQDGLDEPRLGRRNNPDAERNRPMQSRHVADFNHDPWAEGYDAEVQNEQTPVRAGYSAVLDWTVAAAQITPAQVVVDLGSGTGNTSARIGAAARIVCVDISARMTAIAAAKLAHRPEVSFVQADLLGFFAIQPRFDALVSTYAVHHLTGGEKGELLRLIAAGLRPGGRAVFGDLMVKNAAEQQRLVALYRGLGDADSVEGLTEEFYWRIDLTLPQIAAAGLELVEVRRFSELSWGICARRPAQASASRSGGGC